MFIALGVLTGFLGFLPMFIALRLSRRSTSTQALTIGLYGLAGAAVSGRSDRRPCRLWIIGSRESHFLCDSGNTHFFGIHSYVCLL